MFFRQKVKLQSRGFTEYRITVFCKRSLRLDTTQLVNLYIFGWRKICNLHAVALTIKLVTLGSKTTTSLGEECSRSNDRVKVCYSGFSCH